MKNKKKNQCQSNFLLVTGQVRGFFFLEQRAERAQCCDSVLKRRSYTSLAEVFAGKVHVTSRKPEQSVENALMLISKWYQVFPKRVYDALYGDRQCLTKLPLNYSKY